MRHPSPLRPHRAPFVRWLLALALSCAGLVGTVAAASAQETSPGPLAQSHAKVEEQCARCHTPGKGATDDQCVACHKTARTSKFHGQMAKEANKTCASCHRDHRGRTFAMVRWTPPTPFPHEKTGFELRGAHPILACKACHTSLGKWTGLKPDCGACHKDQHQPSLGSRCADCHTDLHFRGAERFDHNRAKFTLTGKHKDVTCKRCHQDVGIKGKFRGLSFALCSECHKERGSDHSGGQDCAACHNTVNWKQVAKDGAIKLHARTRLPLLGKHAETKCELCHTPARAAPDKSKQGFGPIDPACTTCHVDPHSRRFGMNCKQCHGFVEWRLSAASGFDHNRTNYKLEGLHKRASCASCHPPGLPYAKRYLGKPTAACTDCHKDPHGGPFASVVEGDRCETCHSVQGFTPARYGIADHDRIRFRLEGAHRVVACGGCHVEVQQQPPKLHGTPTTCAGCHKDPHGGQFVADGAPVSCSSCHGIQSFVPTVGFDHARTHFPLTGSHAKVLCTACHFRPAPGKPVQFNNVRESCEACHKDIHLGQFRGGEQPEQGAARGCGDCHTMTPKFRIAAFDHAKTRYALDGRHVQVACAKCHMQVMGPGGQNAVHYRLGTPACEACHHNPHLKNAVPVVAPGAKGPVEAWTCRRCHTTRGWSAVPERVEFDHASTGTVLTGAHARAACSGCHRPADRAGGQVPRACTGCHTDPHKGELGTQCTQCHSATNWRAPRTLPSHETTRFPLTGAHTATECTACHTRLGREVYRGTTSICGDCHSRVAQNIRKPDHRLLGFGPGCQVCHSTFSWGPAIVNHTVWWALDGRHAAVDCIQCHGNGVWRGLSAACVSCHKGVLETAHPDHKAMGFPMSCQDCHAATAWNLLKKTWHDTYFPIVSGAHNGIACASCHGGSYNTAQLICTSCHTHSESATKKHHDGVGGYTWQSAACYGCHRKG